MQGSTEEGLVLAQKFRILKKIGSGSFGYIYVCTFVVTQAKVQRTKISTLQRQQKWGDVGEKIKGWPAPIRNQTVPIIPRHSQHFGNAAGIAKLYDYGYEGQKIFMVIDLLESSLEDVFENHNRNFSISTVFQIGLQIINRLQAIHRKGFVHRDIKANNFMIGKGDKKGIVYIIDFGLAKRYRDPKNGTHIPFKQGKSLVGTARYASVASHLGYEQGRKDDLESLGFLLLYFLRGKLPWQGVQIKSKTQKYAEIGQIKKSTSIEQITKGYEGSGKMDDSLDAFIKYFAYVRSVTFAQEPKYELVKKILREELVKNGKQDAPLDWLQNAEKK